MTLGGSKGLMPTFIGNFDSAGKGGLSTWVSIICLRNLPGGWWGDLSCATQRLCEPGSPTLWVSSQPQGTKGLVGTRPQGSECSVWRLLQWTWCGQVLLPKSTSSAEKMWEEAQGESWWD